MSGRGIGAQQPSKLTMRVRLSPLAPNCSRGRGDEAPRYERGYAGSTPAASTKIERVWRSGCALDRQSSHTGSNPVARSKSARRVGWVYAGLQNPIARFNSAAVLHCGRVVIMGAHLVCTEKVGVRFPPCPPQGFRARSSDGESTTLRTWRRRFDSGRAFQRPAHGCERASSKRGACGFNSHPVVQTRCGVVQLAGHSALTRRIKVRVLAPQPNRSPCGLEDGAPVS